MNDMPTVNAMPEGFRPLRLRLRPGGQVVDIQGPNIVLGRHSECDVRMPLPDVSRRHCRFVFTAGCWDVVDLGSLNGVHVNGVRVQRITLHPGDHIRLGGLELDVEMPSAAAAA